MSKFSELVCGSVRAGNNGNLARSLLHFSSTLNLLKATLGAKKKHRSADRLIVPFMVRSMIELACTSLIARFDPFRILTLAKIQEQATYDVTEKVASSLQWRGDVIADGKITDLWKMSRTANDMTRALLGDYQNEIFWQPAFFNLLDYLQETENLEEDSWLRELKTVEPTSHVPRFRGEALKIYSAASKGIHHEFVLSISSYYDDATLDQLSDDVVKLVANMALVSNFSECITYKLTPIRAVQNYRSLQP